MSKRKKFSTLNVLIALSVLALAGLAALFISILNKPAVEQKPSSPYYTIETPCFTIAMPKTYENIVTEDSTVNCGTVNDVWTKTPYEDKTVNKTTPSKTIQGGFFITPVTDVLMKDTNVTEISALSNYEILYDMPFKEKDQPVPVATSMNGIPPAGLNTTTPTPTPTPTPTQAFRPEALPDEVFELIVDNQLAIEVPYTSNIWKYRSKTVIFAPNTTIYKNSEGDRVYGFIIDFVSNEPEPNKIYNHFMNSWTWVSKYK